MEDKILSRHEHHMRMLCFAEKYPGLAQECEDSHEALTAELAKERETSRELREENVDARKLIIETARERDGERVLTKYLRSRLEAADALQPPVEQTEREWRVRNRYGVLYQTGTFNEDEARTWVSRHIGETLVFSDDSGNTWTDAPQGTQEEDSAR